MKQKLTLALIPILILAAVVAVPAVLPVASEDTIHAQPSPTGYASKPPLPFETAYPAPPEWGYPAPPTPEASSITAVPPTPTPWPTPEETILPTHIGL